MPGQPDNNNEFVILRTPSGRERRLPALRPGWKWVHLGEVTEVVRGASPRPKGDPRYFGGEIPWIMISDVTRQPGKYLSETKQRVTEAGAELSRKLPTGSLILSNSGTVCIPKILKVDGCIHDGFVAFPTLEKNVDLNFAYYWFEAVRPRIIDENRQGVTQVNLNTGIVREMPFPLAPREQQTEVVAEIEKEFTRLDAGVASLKRVQTALKRYRASVLKAACEGRLVLTEAELARKENRSYEAGEQLLQRMLRKRREKWNGRGEYKEPATPDPPDLPELPEGWTWACAEQITSVITDGEHITPRRSDSGVLLLSARNILNGKLALEDVDYVPQSEYERIAKRLTIEPADVLLSCSGTVGRSTVAPKGLTFTLVRSVAVLKPLLGMGKYLSLTLRCPILQQQILRKKTQTAQANIFQGKIKTLCVPLPPLAEQARIVAQTDRRLSVVEELEISVNAAMKRAARLRQGILKDAFSVPR